MREQHWYNCSRTMGRRTQIAKIGALPCKKSEKSRCRLLILANKGRPMNLDNRGRWPRSHTKPISESYPALDMQSLRSAVGIRLASRGWRRWTRDGQQIAYAQFNIYASHNGSRFIWLNYGRDIRSLRAVRIPLLSTRPNYGGVRWWFACPRLRDGCPCARRVRRLYLRRGYFACRLCHDLTYRSSQEAHRLGRMFKMSGTEKEISEYFDGDWG